MFLTREELIELSGGRRPSSICDFGGFCNAVERVLAGGLEDNAKVTGLSVSEGPVD